ncbi:hypothetical protein VTH82DRAFT_5168 [Thermothelomyces myriococcoides]
MNIKPLGLKWSSTYIKPVDDLFCFGGDGTGTVATCKARVGHPTTPWLGQASETWHLRPPTLLAHTQRRNAHMCGPSEMAFLNPPSTHPLGLPRAVATQNEVPPHHASNHPIFGDLFGHPVNVMASARSTEHLQAAAVPNPTVLQGGEEHQGLPDKPEWGPAAAGNHSNRDTSGALAMHLQAVHRCLAAIGDLDRPSAPV